MQRHRGIFLAALAAVLLPIGASADHPRTITEIVAASGGDFDRNGNDFDILLNAVLAAELDGALADPHASLTVFAPNDRAFVWLARQFGFEGNDEAGAFNAIVSVLTDLSGGDPIPLLTDILLYHVSPEARNLHEIRSTETIDTLLDGATLVSVWLRLLDNEPELKDPRIISAAADIQAVNGFIHTINRVLIPVDIDNIDRESLPTITGAVVASGGDFDANSDDFDILLNAVLTANLAGALDNPADNLTVYAPTDAAFIRTARALGFHGHDEAGAFQFIVEALTGLSADGDPIPLLTAILLYHVSPDGLSLKATLEAEMISTLLEDATISPDPVTRELGDNDPNLRNARPSIQNGDIRVSNGFIQPISLVLIPVDLSTL